MYSSAKDMRAIAQEKVMCQTKDGNWVLKDLIEGSSSEQWDYIEGSAFNLKLDSIRVPDFNADKEDLIPYIGPDERFTPPTVSLDPWEFDLRGKKRFGWMIPPGAVLLLVSEEITNVPIDCFMPVKGRFSFASAFAAMVSTDAHPNYQGRITTLLTVNPLLPLALGKGCEFCFIRLAHLSDKESDAYKGIWGVEGYGSTTEGEAARSK
jgi:deoxycytidine triphosphate deaminase